MLKNCLTIIVKWQCELLKLIAGLLILWPSKQSNISNASDDESEWEQRIYKNYFLAKNISKYIVVDVYRKNIRISLSSADIMCLPNKIKLTSRTVRYFFSLRKYETLYSQLQLTHTLYIILIQFIRLALSLSYHVIF